MRKKLLHITSALLILCLMICLPVSALADKPTVTVHPTGKNADGSYRTVAPGGTISYTADAVNYASRTWRIVSPDATRVYLAGEINQVFPGLVVSGSGTSTLTLSNVPEGMNNWCVEAKFSNYEGDSMTRGAIIHVSAGGGSSPTWTPPADVTVVPVIGDGGEIDINNQKPTITTQLTADRSYQTVGGSYAFTCVGANYTQRYWYLINPSGSYYEVTANAASLFPTMGVSGTETNTLSLSNVPQNLNNWRVQVRFLNAYGEIYSNAATIVVVDSSMPTPQPTSSPGAPVSGVITAREPVNVRATPNGAVIGTLQPGTVVTITDRSNPEWYRVTAGTVSGYVAARLISLNTGTGTVTVTKNPTGESTGVGGTVTFIAHARNASSVTWRLVSADTLQTVYAANASSSFPGVKVYGANSDTLTLSNVPASLNGWSAEAMFSGPGGPVYSTGARITVNSAPSYTAPSYATPSSAPAAAPAATSAPIGAGLNVTGLPMPLTLEHGHSDVLSVQVAGGNETVHYQWYRSATNSNQNGAAIGGANTASYIPEEITGTTYYYAQVWTDSGLSLTTPAVPVTYNGAPAATPVPTATSTPVSTETPTEETSVPTTAVSVQPQQSTSSNRNALILLGIVIVAAAAALIFTLVTLRKYDRRSSRDEFQDDDEYDENDVY